MANIINGTSTGSGGLITTGDSSDELQLQTAETTALTITSGQQSAFIAGTASAPAVTTTGDLNTGIYFPAADNIGFATGGTIRGRWTTDGLCFGSDTAAANALDDYEEGTWTPVWERTTTNPTYSGQNAAGRYTKIGRQVTVSWDFSTNSISGNGSGNWYIAGLPFTSASGSPNNFASIGRIYDNAEVTGLRAQNNDNTTFIYFVTISTDQYYAATPGGFTILQGTLTYFV